MYLLELIGITSVLNVHTFVTRLGYIRSVHKKKKRNQEINEKKNTSKINSNKSKNYKTLINFRIHTS